MIPIPIPLSESFTEAESESALIHTSLGHSQLHRNQEESHVREPVLIATNMHCATGDCHCATDACMQYAATFVILSARTHDTTRHDTMRSIDIVTPSRTMRISRQTNIHFFDHHASIFHLPSSESPRGPHPQGVHLKTQAEA